MKLERFTEVPGGYQWKNKSVLAWHNSVESSITPDPVYYQLRQIEIQRLGCGAWVTETGSSQLDLSDEFGFSWMHWGYKWFSNVTWDNPGLFRTEGPYDPCLGTMDQCLDTEIVKTYARIYPQAVAGQLIEFVFDSVSNRAQLRYSIRPGCQKPTEIFIPLKWRFQNGFNAILSPDGLASWSLEGNLLKVVHSTPVRSAILTVTILPK